MTSRNPMDPQTRRIVTIFIASASLGGIAYLVHKKMNESKAAPSPGPVVFQPIPNATPSGPSAPVPASLPVEPPVRSGPTTPPVTAPSPSPSSPSTPLPAPAPAPAPMPVPKEWVVLPNNVEGQKVLQKGMRYRISMPPEANLFALEVNALKNIGFKVLEAFDDHTSAPFDWPGQEIGAAWRFTVEWPEANPIKIYPSPNVIYYQEIDRLTGVRYRLPYRLPY